MQKPLQQCFMGPVLSTTKLSRMWKKKKRDSEHAFCEILGCFFFFFYQGHLDLNGLLGCCGNWKRRRVSCWGSEKTDRWAPKRHKEKVTEQEQQTEEGKEGMNYWRGTVSGSILTVWAVVFGEAALDRSDSSGGAALLRWCSWMWSKRNKILQRPPNASYLLGFIQQTLHPDCWEHRERVTHMGIQVHLDRYQSSGCSALHQLSTPSAHSMAPKTLSDGNLSALLPSNTSCIFG